MLRLIVAAGVGLLASVGAMLFGGNQPAYWLRRLVAPGIGPRGFDLFVFDHYFVIDQALLVVNFIVFGSVVYALWALGLRLVSPQGQRGAGA